MQRHILTIILTIFLSFCLCACSANTKTEEQLPAAALKYEGFDVKPISGGAEINGCNLSAMNIKRQEEDTIITLDFRLGSNLTQGDTELTLRTLPNYTITLLEEPFRLSIAIGKLDYTDYLLNNTYNTYFNSAPADEAYSNQSLPENAVTYAVEGLLLDDFGISDAQSSAYTLYFQLSSNAVYKVEEVDSALIITLRPYKDNAEAVPDKDEDNSNAAVDVSSAEKAGEGEAYYVVANALDQYRSGVLGCKDAMTPTLSNDMQTIMLISSGFESKAAANELMDSILNSESNAIPSQWNVVKLKRGELPEYASRMEYMAAYDALPYKTSSQDERSSVFIPDGLALTLTPSRAECLYSKRIKEYTAGGETIEYEQLWLYGSKGSRTFAGHHFEQIVSAAYSPDGRRLAVLEMAGESSHLYVFDVDSRDLITDLSAVGFGEAISAYCWDSLGGRLFSISGSSDICVHQYDFNVPDEAQRHSIVDKKGCDEGIISYANGEVFFVETSMDTGSIIYRIKPEGGTRREFMQGNNFRVSPDSRYMAYTRSAFDTAESTAQIFGYIDMQSGSFVEITRQFNVFTFIWSNDASKLYYIENRLSGSGDDGEDAPAAEGSEYPYTLWVHDIASGQSKAVAELASISIMPGRDSDTVYICYKDSETLGGVIRATYALNTAG